MSGEHLPILLYHSVADDVTGAFAPYAISREAFGEHLDLLVERGHTVLTVSSLVQAIASGRPLPERPVVVTFDDGFADFADAAWPELSDRDIPATLYVTCGPLGGTSDWLRSEGQGNRPMLSWDALRGLAAEGCEIGAHTVSHPPLDCLSRAQAEHEIRASKSELEDGLGRLVPSFAYPHGHHDRHVRQMVIDAGFESACAVKNALSHPDDDRFALARITVTGDVSATTLADRLEGRGVPRAHHRERLRTTAWRTVRRRRHRRATSLHAT
jgi:peptidoglycan/xylan/chitin deacetylase (PgdA/CDA1 family)